MSLDDFKTLLEKHDWTYMFSDDDRAYVAGLQSSRTIQCLITGDPTGQFEKAFQEHCS
jgi:hypothetical protein